MGGGPEDEDAAAVRLPETLPIFPLDGVLLLPRGKLPLNIFEPRYLNMTRDAMESERLIGMVQPADSGAPEPSPVYPIGCAGRITSFAETDDGRFLIALTGVSRFRIRRELPVLRGYRRVEADWAPFARDLAAEAGFGVDRQRLMTGLKRFFRKHGLSADWDAIAATPDERLVTLLAMICPFGASEKQALLEAATLTDRARLMIALIEMALAEGGAPDGGPVRH
jgi:Lon protease-like protein